MLARDPADQLSMELSSMKTEEFAESGTERLAALYALDLIEGEPSERFDRIARLASRSLRTPIALITLIDDDEQLFCAAVGTDETGTSRADSFCTHAIAGSDPVMVVPDTHLDERFVDNALVTGSLGIRFYAGAPISTAGQRIGTLCVIDIEPRQISDDELQTLRDLADLVEQELHHTRMAMTDTLTGLANRRAFEASAERFLALGHRRSEPVSLVFADVNGLKLVNDEVGHILGDDLLRRAAAALTANIRNADIIARIGGDEFAILLYGVSAQDAPNVVDNIQHRIALDNELESASAPLSIAFGISTSQAGDDVTSLVHRADEAMYESKRRTQQRRTAL